MDIKDMKKLREETQSKWESLGFLEGLKGHIKPEIAELYECCKTAKIDNNEPIIEENINLMYFLDKIKCYGKRRSKKEFPS